MKIGIYGYGNLGRAAEVLASDFDMDVACVFTRRDPDSVRTLRAPVYERARVGDFSDEIDCMLLCGSSHSDITNDALELSKDFNTVDAFDIHSEIPKHKEKLDEAAKASGHVSIVSTGWDPGLLSVFRTYFSAIMPRGEVNTFWGRGVSQGHSAVIRRIKGVRRAVEYTVPLPDAMALARVGRSVDKFKRHERICYVVANEEDYDRIEREIKSIPEYYAGYNVTVHFISQDEFVRSHVSMPHRGECIAFGMSGFYREHINRAELSISMDSNPEFTASVMLAYAKVCDKLCSEKHFGAYDVLDVPMRYLLSRKNGGQLL